MRGELRVTATTALHLLALGGEPVSRRPARPVRGLCGATDGAAYVSAVPRLDDVGFSPAWIDALSYRRDKSIGVIRNLNVHFQRRDIATAIQFHLHLFRI